MAKLLNLIPKFSYYVLSAKLYEVIYFFISFYLTLNFVQSISVLPLSSRNTCFEDFRRFQKLTGNSSAIFTNMPRFQCASKCLKSPNCLSFNFCGRKTCELNTADAHSKNFVLEKDNFCSYFGMRQNAMPECIQKGYLNDILNDNAIEELLFPSYLLIFPTSRALV